LSFPPILWDTPTAGAVPCLPDRQAWLEEKFCTFIS